MDLVNHSTPYLLLDFVADWCEPCKWAEPVIGQVIVHFKDKISLHKIDIDQHPELAREYHVLSVPTFILFKEGKELWRMRGFDTAPVMIRALEQVVS
jgi:thioredoxin 1